MLENTRSFKNQTEVAVFGFLCAPFLYSFAIFY
jgi:hypothetical protein